ncbi:MAG: protein phosphatase 2C domain-containing protein [Pirellulaceae bacterium]|nr:serine/threonine-protein phosphatase [Planctomycetales bacterium]
MSTASEVSSQFFRQQDMREACPVPVAGGIAFVYSARCPDKSTPNEDAAAVIRISESTGVLVLADGLGGGAFGEQAANLALKHVRSEVVSAVQEDTLLRSAVLNGFERANEAVLDLGSGTATTLAVVEIDGHNMRPYHVGDSAILVVGQRGKIKFQSVPHSPVGYAVESGMLAPDEAMHHEDRHIVSNVIGMSRMRIDLGPPIPLSPLDTVLLASDGLMDNLHLNEVVEFIRKGPLDVVADQLATVAGQRMRATGDHLPSKPDDLTFVVWRRSTTKSVAVIVAD